MLLSHGLWFALACCVPQLFVYCNDAKRTCVVAARLDNLGKGASGAAVQNLNIALGLDEATGL